MSPQALACYLRGHHALAAIEVAPDFREPVVHRGRCEAVGPEPGHPRLPLCSLAPGRNRKVPGGLAAGEERHLTSINHCRNRFGRAARAFVICRWMVPVHGGLNGGLARLWQVARLVSAADEVSGAGVAAGFTIVGLRQHDHTRLPHISHISVAAPAVITTDS